MHLLGIAVVLAYLIHTNLASDEFSQSDYYEYYEQEQGDEPDSPPEPDMEQRLRSASSVDELMSLVNPSYWSALKCSSKLATAAAAGGAGGVASSAQAAFRVSGAQGAPTRPLEEPGYAAAFYNMDVLKSIEAEWSKTKCMPREVCVDVGRELGTPTNVFYKPPCVSVYRCGGCCESEDKQCRNISTGFLSKTLFEITVPYTHNTKPVTISVANHTRCSCLSKPDVYKQVHSIIRRALPECPIANRTCPPSQAWNSRLCRCVAKTTTWQQSLPPPPPPPPLRPAPQYIDIFAADACGPDKELDVETCQCVCRRGDGDGAAAAACGPRQRLDRNTCRCVCDAPPSPACPANHVFDRESCGCACDRTCPRHQPLNRARCTCECSESPNRCFLKGRRFHQATCSCHRPPCEARRRRCEPGFSFSEEVCRCVPSHWRRLD